MNNKSSFNKILNCNITFDPYFYGTFQEIHVASELVPSKLNINCQFYWCGKVMFSLCLSVHTGGGGLHKSQVFFQVSGPRSFLWDTPGLARGYPPGQDWGTPRQDRDTPSQDWDTSPTKTGVSPQPALGYHPDRLRCVFPQDDFLDSIFITARTHSITGGYVFSLFTRGYPSQVRWGYLHPPPPSQVRTERYPDQVRWE